MHKYKKNEQKFIFRLVFSVFGLRGVAVASVFPRISLICTDLCCYPSLSVFIREINGNVKSVIKSLSFRFLSRNYLITTSIPIHYHPVLSPYSATYLSAFMRRVSPASTPYTLHFTPYTFHFSP